MVYVKMIPLFEKKQAIHPVEIKQIPDVLCFFL